MQTIAIVGAGAVGLSSAALLASRGHEVRVWSAFSEENQAIRTRGGVVAEGALEGRFPVAVPSSAAACIDAAGVVMIAAPAFAHEALAEMIAPHVADDQHVVMHSATGMTSLMVARLLAAHGARPAMIDLGTSVCTSRKSGPASVKLGPLKPGVGVATIPSNRLPDGLAVMEALFGSLFDGRPNALELSLNNHNAIYHVPAFLFSLADVENARDWNLWGNTTPLVARYVERLDRERLAVAEAYGVAGIPVGDYIRSTVDVDGATLAEVFAAARRKRPAPTGPKSLDDRYVTEDVPFGLAFFVAMGRAAGLAMPMTSQLLAFVSTVFDRDFEREGVGLEALGIAGLAPEAIVRIVEEGFPQSR